ncbi:TPA: hypothetical protein IAD52_01840 [Candidatus Spyradomonas excrementavium]|nr:hypothetical protein [Candidatus Spyradomonas excrementavium]
MIKLETGYKYLGEIKNAIKSKIPAELPFAGEIFASKLFPLKADTIELGASVPFLQRSEQQIKLSIKKALKKECIGHGAEAKVYRIPDTDYVVRVHKGFKPDFNSPISFDMSTGDKFNHYVAKIGDSVEIGEYIKGENACCLNGYTNKMSDKQHNLNLKIVEMPVSSYRDFMKTIFEAAKQNMAFDCAGRNVIVDIAQKKFIPIDFEYGFAKNPRQRIFNPILCMHSGFSVREPDLQFKFIKKVLDAFGLLAKSDYDFTLSSCKFEPRLNMLPFNLQKIKNKQFYDDVEILNNYIQNVAAAKLMNAHSPMFTPAHVVQDAVKQLSEQTSLFVEKYTG